MSASWDELCVEVPREQGEAAAACLLELGSAGLQEEDPDAPPPRQLWDPTPAPPPGPWLRLKAWFARPGGTERAAVEAALAGFRPRHASWQEEEARDWEAEAQASFRPIQAGRFLIAPPWDAPAGALLITPGSGFGTGDHPTTQAMLLALSELCERPELRERLDEWELLDVGCGSGILALAGASLGLRARGIDIEAAALEEAAANAELNGLSLSLGAEPLAACAPADLVLANLHAEVLLELAPELRRVTRRCLLVAGVLREKEPAVLAAFAPWTPAERRADERWVFLRFEAPDLSSGQMPARAALEKDPG